MDVVLLLESINAIPKGAHADGDCRSRLFRRRVDGPNGSAIMIQEDLSKSVGEVIWPLCLVLCDHVANADMFERGAFWRGKRVLELGAGTGLLGIVLGLLGADVLVTDVPPVTDLMRANVDDNNRALGLSVRADELDWFRPVPKPYRADRCAWDVILLAEAVYNPVLFEPLIRTLMVVSRPTTMILMAYEARHKVEQTFVSRLERYFSVRECSWSHSAATAAAAVQPKSAAAAFSDGSMHGEAKRDVPYHERDDVHLFELRKLDDAAQRWADDVASGAIAARSSAALVGDTRGSDRIVPGESERRSSSLPEVTDFDLLPPPLCYWQVLRRP